MPVMMRKHRSEVKFQAKAERMEPAARSIRLHRSALLRPIVSPSQPMAMPPITDAVNVIDTMSPVCGRLMPSDF